MPKLDKESIAVVNEILKREARQKPYMRPPLTSVVLHWRCDIYIGGVQCLRDDSDCRDDGIYILTKSSRSYNMLLDAFRHVQPERLELHGDDQIDLSGRLHVVRIINDKVHWMNQEQTEWAKQNVQHLIEVYDGKTEICTERQLLVYNNLEAQ